MTYKKATFSLYQASSGRPNASVTDTQIEIPSSGQESEVTQD